MGRLLERKPACAFEPSSFLFLWSLVARRRQRQSGSLCMESASTLGFPSMLRLPVEDSVNVGHPALAIVPVLGGAASRVPAPSSYPPFDRPPAPPRSPLARAKGPCVHVPVRAFMRVHAGARLRVRARLHACVRVHTSAHVTVCARARSTLALKRTTSESAYTGENRRAIKRRESRSAIPRIGQLEVLIIPPLRLSRTSRCVESASGPNEVKQTFSESSGSR
jgi:hypothetical protein